MESASLSHIADLLDTLESGVWLQQQLAEYVLPSSHPRVLVLLSAPRSFQQIFPDGAQIDPSWQIWPENEELTISVLEQADLIIWLMSALRLFPGEYNLALEQARQQSISLWAIVTGLERLSDENSFLHQRLPNYRASLPAGSQFFLVRPTMRTPLQKTIVQALDKEGLHLLKQGNDRRLKILTTRLKERLHEERQAISRRLSKAEQFASTAQAGVSSLKILTSATTTTLLAEYYALLQTIEKLKSTLLEKAVVEGVHEPLDTLVDIFVGAVYIWQQETFEPALQEKATRAKAHLQQWYEEYTQEVTEFFRFSHSLDKATPPANPPLPMEQFDLYLNTLQKTILQSFDRFLLSFRYSIKYVTDIEVEMPKAGSLLEEPSREESSKEESYSYQSNYQQEQSTHTSRALSLRRWVSGLIKHGRRRLNEWSDSPYDYEQQRKEVFQELVHQHIEWFLDDLLSQIRQQKKPLNTFLESVQSTLGDQHLKHIQSTLTTPQEQLALLAEAERLLRGNA